ncbi:MAG TPA: hypothetical protein EYG11_00125, partial [Candidatus Latescibacteria bacterium]|nr:hypothetical protein [Candidatus Latescibacterota bacterium]
MLYLFIVIILAGCGSLDRSNPFDSARNQVGKDQQSQTDTTAETAELNLYLPLGKALATVIYRVEAVITGPNISPISRILDISPLGPATGTIGALQPGDGYHLTLRGYDLNDELIFEGQQKNITISNNDTTLVEFELTLLKPLPDLGGDTGETKAPDDGTTP